MADIAILVVDINEGFKPQTFEAVDILRTSKTPFIIAANKVDLVGGFNLQPFEKGCSLKQLLDAQGDGTKQLLDEKMYSLIGQFYERFHMNAERFDRVDDYTKQVAIVPCSAKARVGIAEILVLVTALAQKFLESGLKIDATGMAKGTILEVKDSPGLGKTLDVILYDGMLNVNDTIIIGAMGEPIVTRVKALFQPNPLHEMRDKKSQFMSIKQAVAATGVRISAPDIENAVAGMPLQECDPKNVDEAKERIRAEIEEVLLDTDEQGIIIKADSLGSVEAILKLFGEKSMKIRKATIGEITKKDVLDAESNYEKDPLLSAIIAFNVGVAKNVEVPPKVKVITSDIIYRLLDEYEAWTLEKKKSLEAEQLDLLVRPCKIEVLQNCIFRQSNPAIVGVYVMVGTLKVGMPLMKADGEGKALAQVKSIQAELENITILEQGKQAAISLPGVVCGRQLFERNMLYSAIPEEDFKKLKKLRKYLTEAEVQVMREIADIMRKNNPVWGV